MNHGYESGAGRQLDPMSGERSATGVGPASGIQGMSPVVISLITNAPTMSTTSPMTTNVVKGRTGATILVPWPNSVF